MDPEGEEEEGTDMQGKGRAQCMIIQYPIKSNYECGDAMIDRYFITFHIIVVCGISLLFDCHCSNIIVIESIK